LHTHCASSASWATEQIPISSVRSQFSINTPMTS
jgi:hypothetical protein